MADRLPRTRKTARPADAAPMPRPAPAPLRASPPALPASPPALRTTPAALIIAGAVAALALPSAVLAFSSRLDVAPPGGNANQGLGSFAPGSIDPHLARALASRTPGMGALFRFTPAGLAARPDRLVTVAVRVGQETAQTIIVRAATARTGGAPASASTTALRIAPAAYNLGLLHSYQGFAPGMQNFVLAGESRRADTPDLNANFSGGERGGESGGAAGQAPRLAAHLQLGERDRPGRAPRTLESVGEQSVDLGGSYRLTRNLDVTAGVRYSQDRDQIKPLVDGKSDSQAVFVGTQFKF